MMDRRTLLKSGMAASAALIARARLAEARQPTRPDAPPGAAKPAAPIGPKKLTRGRVVAGERYTPVVQPNGSTLPFEKKAGVKVFHLIAEPVKRVVAPGLEIEAWGYNGSTPGPLIECVEGDNLRIYVTNKLPEATSVHWHGVFLPNGMDGVAGLNQKPIPAGETYKYEFPMVKPGTFMYHPHFDEMLQIAMGMQGMIVVHPKRPDPRRVRDYALMTQEWMIPIGQKRPDVLEMTDFNVLAFNGKAFPATEPLVAELGDLVRIRLGNLGPMSQHPIHIHGHAFQIVYTDGGEVPKAARWPETTVIMPVGGVRVVEFISDAPGDWAFHCHMTHHIMNQMGHAMTNVIGADMRGIDPRVSRVVPNYMTHGQTGMGEMPKMQLPQNSISMLGGAGPFGHIDMGGMFTIVKARKKLEEEGLDPGWYDHPEGTVASKATAGELARDGIES